MYKVSHHNQPPLLHTLKNAKLESILMRKIIGGNHFGISELLLHSLIYQSVQTTDRGVARDQLWKRGGGLNQHIIYE